MRSFEVPKSQWNEQALEGTKASGYNISLQALDELELGLRDGRYNKLTENFTKLLGMVIQRIRMGSSMAEIKRNPPSTTGPRTTRGGKKKARKRKSGGGGKQRKNGQ